MDRDDTLRDLPDTFAQGGGFQHLHRRRTPEDEAAHLVDEYGFADLDGTQPRFGL